MADNETQSGKQTAIVSAEERQRLRLPDESAQAYSGFCAYLDVESGKRSIAAAYWQLKGLDPDAKVKAADYFGVWAARSNRLLIASSNCRERGRGSGSARTERQRRAAPMPIACHA